MRILDQVADTFTYIANNAGAMAAFVVNTNGSSSSSLSESINGLLNRAEYGDETMSRMMVKSAVVAAASAALAHLFIGSAFVSSITLVAAFSLATIYQHYRYENDLPGTEFAEKAINTVKSKFITCIR